jgi:hypothetical protein
MNVSLDVQRPQSSVSVTHYDAVVGTGLYGLSTAAYLFEQGLDLTILGKPLSLWCERMPKGMLVRSYWWATTISDPHTQYGLERYFRENGQRAIDPLQVETFIEYGLWFRSMRTPMWMRPTRRSYRACQRSNKAIVQQKEK